MVQFLYNIFIMPIENIIQIIFSVFNKIFPAYPGISILFVSIFVNILVLPIYKRADNIQEEERERQREMDTWLKHIRKTFKGDERIMMMNAYYKQRGYKPFYAILGSMSLIFQIPFFIAAYHFLSNLELLNNTSFWLIPDLGKPDGILNIAGLSINVLPILMTLINIVSGMIYTKGFKLKDKLQLYLMALLFLVLLYKSPAGLVLYWTFNNIFSLLKNVVMKMVGNKNNHVQAEKEKKEETVVEHSNLFILQAAFLTLFFGSLIPLSVLSASPTEFAVGGNSPFFLMFNTLSVYFGLFFVWFLVFYKIGGAKFKRYLTGFLWLLTVVAIVDYYFFYGKFGTMTTNLCFHLEPVFSRKTAFINAAVLLAIAAAVIYLFIRYKKLLSYVYIVLCVTVSVLVVTNFIGINSTLREEGYYELSRNSEFEPIIPLSTEGQNVVFIMLDRAISEYVPYIFNEKPELLASYEDFVYYPNTLSFGGYTNLASPALFGGYEYTPTELNKRDSESIVSKHNEALCVMPAIFNNNGYNVTVCDPVYAGYQDIPDLNIYDEYERVNAYRTIGTYKGEILDIYDPVVQRRNFFYYSVFRTLPVVLQKYMYDSGKYLGLETGSNNFYPECLDSYMILDGLDKLTDIVDDDSNNFFMIDNNTAHEPCLLKLPEYVPSDNPSSLPLSDEVKDSYVVDGVRLKMDEYEQVAHYQVNMASFIKLAEWLDYLKEQGVYDNTRIIICADHGRNVNQIEGRLYDFGVDVESYNPLLMVKDFKDCSTLMPVKAEQIKDSKVYISHEFMTNADVPTLATKGVIEQPVNPFSGKAISMDDKDGPQIVTTSGNFEVDDPDNMTVFDTSDGLWYYVSGNIFDSKNWSYAEE